MPAIRTSKHRVPALTPDGNKIKRPPNSWILYRSDKSKDPLYRQLLQGDISRLIGQAWANESPDVKMEYEREAERRKLEHTILYPEYRFAPQSKGKKKQAAQVVEKQEEQSGASRDSCAIPNMTATGEESSQASTPSTAFSYSPSSTVYDPEQEVYDGLHPSAAWFEGSILPPAASPQFNTMPVSVGAEGVAHHNYQSTEIAQMAHPDNMNASATSTMGYNPQNIPNFPAVPHSNNANQKFDPFPEWPDYSQTGIELDDYDHSDWFQNLLLSMADTDAGYSQAGPSSSEAGFLMSEFEDFNYGTFDWDPAGIIY